MVSEATLPSINMPSRSTLTSRWGPESAPSTLTGLNTAITAPMTAEQVEAYALHVRIEETTQRIKIDDVVPADHLRRLPSPPPQYDRAGRRTNTRYRRYRERLETESHQLIEQAIRTIPDSHPPGHVHTHTLKREKLYIPAKDFPQVNFIGQILSPRGRSLTEMNAQSGATIYLRGKGSIKDGSSRPRSAESVTSTMTSHFTASSPPTHKSNSTGPRPSYKESSKKTPRHRSKPTKENANS